MRFERTDCYKIHSYDSDLNGRLSLPVLTRFLQETAWLNAEDMHLGYEKFLKDEMAWVLFKQYMEIDEYPCWGDVISIRTWPSQSEKLFCYREFEMYKEEKLIGKISSSWLVIDINSRRPLRTSGYYRKEHQVNNPILFPNIIKTKMTAPDNTTSELEHIVKLADIDVNNHVNNSLYLQWCLNSYPVEFYRRHQIKTIEQQFSSEALLGDKLSIRTSKLSETLFSHRIKNKADKDLFILKLKWKVK